MRFMSAKVCGPEGSAVYTNRHKDKDFVLGEGNKIQQVIGVTKRSWLIEWCWRVVSGIVALTSNE